MAERKGRSNRQGSMHKRRQREVDRVDAAEDMLSELDNLMTELSDVNETGRTGTRSKRNGALKNKRRVRTQKSIANEAVHDGMLLDLDIEVESVKSSEELERAIQVKKDVDDLLKVSGSNQVLIELAKDQRRSLQKIFADITPETFKGGVKENEAFIREIEKQFTKEREERNNLRLEDIRIAQKQRRQDRA